MEHAHEAGIPFLVIVGSDELKKGVVKVGGRVLFSCGVLCVGRVYV